MVSLRKYLVGRASLANRTRCVPPYLGIIKQFEESADEW